MHCGLGRESQSSKLLPIHDFLQLSIAAKNEVFHSWSLGLFDGPGKIQYPALRILFHCEHTSYVIVWHVTIVSFENLAAGASIFGNEQ